MQKIKKKREQKARKIKKKKLVKEKPSPVPEVSLEVIPEIAVEVAKKSSNTYFDSSTETSIVAFQNEPDIEKKKEIFVKDIRPSFLKLVENIIFVYKFHSLGEIDSLKNDCMSFLFETLYKFDGSRGHKAFSYFNVVAKNWFIQKVKIAKKRSKSDIWMDKSMFSKLEVEENLYHCYEDDILSYEQLVVLKDEMKKWRNKFDKKQEKIVLEAIILLLDNPDIIPLYNKKSVYLYLREICHLSTKQLVTNLTKMKKKYELFKKHYNNGEV